MELEQNERGLSCYSTTEDRLYTLEIPQGRDQVLPEFVVEGGYTGAPVKTFQKGWQRKWNEWWDKDDPNFPLSEQEREKKAAEAKKERASDTKANDKKVITLGEPPKEDGLGIRGYLGEKLSLAQFMGIRNKGCVWCGDELTKDKGFAFLSEDSMVCIPCVRDQHPKGECKLDYLDIDEDEDFLDDDLPFDLRPKQEETAEGKKLIATAVAKAGVGE